MTDITSFDFTANGETQCWIDNKQLIGRGELEVTQEVEQITYPHDIQPDLAWTFTDSAGHFHSYDKDGKTPTLKWAHSEPYYCGDCEDEHTDHWQACVICGEKIEPGTYDNGPGSQSIVTDRSMRLTINEPVP